MSQWKETKSSQSPKLKGYEEFVPGSFEYEGLKRAVYRSGDGPAVIVIHEIPGIYHKVLDFARRLNQAGYTTYLPSLTGTPGKSLSPGNVLKALGKLCVAKEFNRFALGVEAPIANWLRALARDAHKACGGPGVGAVGMCFSGGFALAMMADEHVIASVMSQPSMPFAVDKSRRHDCDVSTEDIPKIKAHMEMNDSCLLAMRFSNDVMVPGQRFKYLKDTFGDRFEGITIDSSKGNPHKIKSWAHSVLTRDFVDKPGHPTYQAYERILSLFEKQLKA